MQIKTNPYVLTRKEYFGFLVKNYIRKSWWVHLILWGYLLNITWGVLFYSRIPDSYYILLLIFAVFYPASSIFSFWQYAGGQLNPVYKPKRLVIQGETLEIWTSGDGEEKVRNEEIIKIRRGSGGYLIDISKKQFVFLPPRALASPQDITVIEAEIQKIYN